MNSIRYQVKLLKGATPKAVIQKANLCIQKIQEQEKKFILENTQLFSKDGEYISLNLFHSKGSGIQFSKVVPPELGFVSEEKFENLEESLNLAFEKMREKKYYPVGIQYLKDFDNFSFLITYRFCNLQA